MTSSDTPFPELIIANKKIKIGQIKKILFLSLEEVFSSPFNLKEK